MNRMEEREEGHPGTAGDKATGTSLLLIQKATGTSLLLIQKATGTSLQHNKY
jgi:hypothetical protein